MGLVEWAMGIVEDTKAFYWASRRILEAHRKVAGLQAKLDNIRGFRNQDSASWIDR